MKKPAAQEERSCALSAGACAAHRLFPLEGGGTNGGSSPGAGAAVHARL